MGGLGHLTPSFLLQHIVICHNVSIFVLIGCELQIQKRRLSRDAFKSSAASVMACRLHGHL